MRTILHITIIVLFCYTAASGQQTDDRFVSFSATPAAISLHWIDAKGQALKSLGKVKWTVESRGETLLFAMNAGMYRPDHTPQGLFIDDQVERQRLDTLSGKGNFYMKPNGVFYTTTDNRAVVCTTPDFAKATKVKYATQSGPMLLIDGAVHPAFKQGSANLNVRNGVGILPDGRAIFAMSKQPINFYDFAQFFLNAGCVNALYLDGFVSRTYAPSQQWIQLDGDFGVMIAITERKPN